MDKITARKTGLTARSSLTLQERRTAEEQITSRVISMIEDDMTVGCYVSMADEADTHGILQYCFDHGIRICVPKTVKGTLRFQRITSFDDLKEGNFHVMEPFRGEVIAAEDIDLMIVPLSSFDDGRRRTGYGKGYYDSVLNRCRLKYGIAFEVQKVPLIETDPWDVTLDGVICA